MCHQAVEKILKAYYVFTAAKTPPHSHSLSYLAKEARLYDLFTLAQQEFTDMLEPLNIEARYPSHKEQIMKSLTEERCKVILSQTKELQQWIKAKL
jgi:HEPN domain-containing protein